MAKRFLESWKMACADSKEYALLNKKIESYLPGYDRQMLAEAYWLAKEAHKDQKRESGESYITHPIAVALILTDMKLDLNSIITALLHDVIEDTDITYDDIKNQFGSTIADLVDGVTKLSKVNFFSNSHKKIANLRKLFIASTKDLRVLLVKFADRFHNMKTLGYKNDTQKRKQIARETLNFYLPLVKRFGVDEILGQMGDYAFRELHPIKYDIVANKLNKLPKIKSEHLKRIKKLLQDNHIEAEIKFREKTIYSICSKLENIKSRSKNKNKTYVDLINNIYDIFAIRIIVKNIDNCYRALGVIHNNFDALNGYFKDYISSNKEINGVSQYQSIHTVIKGLINNPIEVQIRTKEMDEYFNNGISYFVHWNYKDKKTINTKNSEFKNELILYSSIQEKIKRFSLDLEKKFQNFSFNLESSYEYRNFVEKFETEFNSEQIVCFTPGEDSIILPKGSIVLDFAYEIHTDIGNQCIKAIINGKKVELDQVLEDHDIVKIITNKTQTPKPSWGNLVKTNKAKMHLKRFFGRQETLLQSERIKKGKKFLEEECSKKQFYIDEHILRSIMVKFGKDNIRSLYYDIGTAKDYQAKRITNSILKAAYPLFDFNEKEDSVLFANRVYKHSATNYNKCTNVKLFHVYLSACCNPLPGEDIVGVKVLGSNDSSIGESVILHNNNCEFAKTDNTIDVEWDSDECKQNKFLDHLEMSVYHKFDCFAAIFDLVLENNITISHVDIYSLQSGLDSMTLSIEVNSLSQVQNLLSILAKSTYCKDVKRKREA